MKPQRAVGVFLLLVFGTLSAVAQSDDDPRIGMQSVVGNSLSVRVMTVSGEPLATPATVEVFSSTGSYRVTQSTRLGGQVVFVSIPSGNLSILVTAAGYLPGHDEVALYNPGRTEIYVYLRPEGMKVELEGPPGTPALAPKALKEAEKGLAALRENKLKDALTHFEMAAQNAPGNPQVHYYLGLVYMRMKDAEHARTSLDKAIQLNPNHGPALAALGSLLFSQNDIPGTVQFIERAHVAGGATIQTLWTLATAYFRLGQFDKSRDNAAKALDLAKGSVPEISLLLARSQFRLGEFDQANKILEALIAAAPANSAATSARELMARMKQRRAEIASNPSSSNPISSGGSPPPATRAYAAPGIWSPPDVETSIPTVLPTPPCSMPGILKGAGENAKKMGDTILKLSATERLEQTDLDENGQAQQRQEGSFLYLAFFRGAKENRILLDEQLALGENSFIPAMSMENAGRGILSFLFHPSLAGNFEFRCEGHSRQVSTSAWQIYFSQKIDSPGNFLSWTDSSGTSIPVRLKGRVWLDQESLQLLRIESDLLEAPSTWELRRAHMAVDYAVVSYAPQNIRLWMPASVETFFQLGDKRYRTRQQFADFRLAALDRTSPNK
ncbi:MAG: tetratricopeptide repeat protein [Acidobacteria bacterium]|nr:tetratricopeptide repeat protein [Acidobacteriota bacterium]